MRNPDTRQRGFVRVPSWFLVLGAILLGTVILAIAIFEEPYNIDELRQARAYGAPLAEVVEHSYQLVQPPLDLVLNALAQRVIGVGDWQQRFLPVVWGIGSLAMIGLLGLRSRLGGIGSASTVLVLATSPLVVSVTAYARPYALPLFLILIFIFATDVWLNDRRMWSAVVLVVVALMLPFSRTGEPLMALASSMVILTVWRVMRRPDWKKGLLLPVVAAAGGLVVGFPVVRRLQLEGASSTVLSETLRWEGLSRLTTDVPLTLAEVFAPWSVTVVVVLVAFIVPKSRELLLDLWWFWSLTATAVTFAVLFVLITPEDQVYADRYTFLWWPPFAVCVGAVVLAVTGGTGLRRLHRSVLAALVSGLLLTLSFRLVVDLTTEEGTDWSALSDAINRSAPDNATVLFDTPRPYGEYRTVFAGEGRYLDSEHHVPHMARVIQRPDTVRDSATVVMALVDYSDDVPNWPIEVPGWHRFDSGNAASLFLPIDEVHGRMGARSALLQFSRMFEPDRGAAMALAAAALAADDGDLAYACEVLEEITESSDDSLVRWIDQSLARAGRFGEWAGACGV